jgi:phage replication-related protein YjqB (UPF0714/DUF867 family)
MQDVYGSFDELRKHHREGVDFDRVLVTRPRSRIIVLAPHGGCLENHTDAIATAVAHEDFSLYCFRSRLGRRGPNLHITSHRFDDPDCVAMVAAHLWAVAIHGCAAVGERVFLGGRDEKLVEDLARSLTRSGIRTDVTGHPYPGKHPNNIVNRSASRMGVQIEMSMPLRRSEAAVEFVSAVRGVLLARHSNDGHAAIRGTGR